MTETSFEQACIFGRITAYTPVYKLVWRFASDAPVANQREYFIDNTDGTRHDQCNRFLAGMKTGIIVVSQEELPTGLPDAS
jgi:hypothetical protein